MASSDPSHFANEHPPADVGHDLVEFLRQATEEVAAEYRRIYNRASEDPGTAGDEGEENWADLLRDWLPTGYHVTTKGRAIGTDGTRSPQLDVIVLKPSYPAKLVVKKTYLADGIAAAFECKTTLTANHITRAAKTAAELRRLVSARTGSPRKELVSPVAFGLLAHSHSWKGARSNPKENIYRALIAADATHSADPREMLDLVCVADTGTWTGTRIAAITPAMIGQTWETVRTLHGLPPEGGVETIFVHPADDSPPAVGAMLANLLGHLAYDDRQLQPIAEYFAKARIGATGSGNARVWPFSIYSDVVRQGINFGRLVNGDRWNEWSIVYW